jgi:hypothetical protein
VQVELFEGGQPPDSIGQIAQVVGANLEPIASGSSRSRQG